MAALASTSLSSCSLEPLAQAIEFKSGAVYTGKLSGGEMNGHGTFRWPSGLQYTGKYVENKRHGYGVQLWPDGSRYEGDFLEDLRHGSGKHWWSSGEMYEGEYIADKKHGRGTYRWCSGASFTGQFEFDMKEGVGTYISSNGEKFEGMYHGNSRDGEGVMTYPGGRQDVGVWRGTKLIKLKFAIQEASFDPWSLHPLSSCHSLGSPDLKSRGKHGPMGPLEVASQELIQAAAEGDITTVTTLLKTGTVHVNVVDRNGHSALFAAAIHSRLDIINILLDNLADVNGLDLSGISALAACHHLLYGPLPEVQKLLKSLPSSHRHSLPSPSSSPSSASEYTLHTSDFVSSSTNTLCEAGSATDVSRNIDMATFITDDSENLCKTESLGALIANSMHGNNQTSSPELTKVNSYPLLHAREKKVRFLPMQTLQKLSSTDMTVAPPPLSSLPTAEVSSLSNVQQEKLVDSFHSEGTSNEAITEIVPENSTVLPEIVPENSTVLPAMGYPSKLPLTLRNTLPQHNQLLLSVAANRFTPTSPFGNSATNEEDLNRTATGESLVTSEAHLDLPPAGEMAEIEKINSSNESCGLSDEQESRTELDHCSSPEDDHLQPKGESISDSECSSSPGPVGYLPDKLDDQNQSNGFLSPLSKVPKPSSSRTAGVFSDSNLSFRSVEPRVAVEDVEDKDDMSSSTSSINKSDMATNLVPHSLQIPLFLHNSELHSSSVFSSTKYGPIMSAAQSTTLLCGNSGHLSDLVTMASGSPGTMEKESSPAPSVKDSIHLLLCRGADPNISSTPLLPLLYSIKAGDTAAVQRLVEEGADTQLSMPKEFGGLLPLQAAVTLPHAESAVITEILLQYGANPNCEEEDPEEIETYSCESLSSSVVSIGRPTSASERETASSTSKKEGGGRGEVSDRRKGGRDLEKEDGKVESLERRIFSADGEGVSLVAGDNWGSSGFSPLHLVCAMSGPDTNLLAEVVPSVAEVLLAHGAEVNKVAKGQSPLSLAIINGHDSTVALLLRHGADPNFPLGRSMGSAMCAITTHSAHKHRELGASLALLRDLLEHGADILLPVKVKEEWKPGTIVDFAHEAFKQDKRLSGLQYSALSKTERVRCRSAKKFIHHLVCLLRYKALENLAREESSGEYLNEDHFPNMRIHRSMSAVDHKHIHSLQKAAALTSREVRSAGMRARRGAISNVLPLCLPEHTLRVTLDEVSKIHYEDPGMEEEKTDSLQVKNGTRKSLSQLFQKVLLLLSVMGRLKMKTDRNGNSVTTNKTQVTFASEGACTQKGESSIEMANKPQDISTDTPSSQEWTLFSFCYECGRSVGVHLAKCSGCRAICYCSHSCKKENLKKGHIEECTGAQVKLIATNKQMLVQKQKARRPKSSS